MPSQGFSTSDAPCQAHTTHQRKLYYKSAFDSVEGMGRGWEWVGLVRGVSSLCIEIIDSLMSWGLFVLIVLTVLTVCWWALPRNMSIKHKAEWTEKKVDVGQIIE